MINYFDMLGGGNATNRALGVAGNLQGLQANRQAMDIQRQQAAMQQQQGEQRSQQDLLTQSRLRLAEGAGAFLSSVQSGNAQGALQIANQYAEDIKHLDPSFTPEMVQQMMTTEEGRQALIQQAQMMTQIAAGPEQSARFVAQQARPVNQGAVPADVAKFEYWKQMNPDATPEQQRQVFEQIINPFERSLASGRGAGAARVETETALVPVKTETRTQDVRAAQQEQRQQALIQAGIDAADASGNLMRSIELLEGVSTGGFNRAALSAKRLFGIESADEAELSANLGRAVLAQLKPIFGAQFTAAEGERLEKIEANFGKSTEGNKRLLRELLDTNLKAARRARNLAIGSGDNVTLDLIEPIIEQIEAFKSGKRNQGVDWFFGDEPTAPETPPAQGRQIGRFIVEVDNG